MKRVVLVCFIWTWFVVAEASSQGDIKLAPIQFSFSDITSPINPDDINCDNLVDALEAGRTVDTQLFQQIEQNLEVAISGVESWVEQIQKTSFYPENYFSEVEVFAYQMNVFKDFVGQMTQLPDDIYFFVNDKAKTCGEKFLQLGAEADVFDQELLDSFASFSKYLGLQEQQLVELSQSFKAWENKGGPVDPKLLEELDRLTKAQDFAEGFGEAQLLMKSLAGYYDQRIQEIINAAKQTSLVNGSSPRLTP